MRFSSFFLLLAALLGNWLFSQERVPVPSFHPSIQGLQQDVQGVTSKVSGATVGLGGGSAVIVHPDGLMLTVAHISDQRGHYLPVRFSDGRRATAIVLGRHKGLDAAVCRIMQRGPWPFVEIGDTDQVESGDWVVALGYPMSFDQGKSPALRVGQVIRKNNEELTCDAPIMGGDSGGPLFDLAGRLIGISSRCERERIQSNYFVNINAVREHWNALVRGGELAFDRNRQTIQLRTRPHRPAMEGQETSDTTSFPSSRSSVPSVRTLRPTIPQGPPSTEYQSAVQRPGRQQALCAVGASTWQMGGQARVDVFVDGRQVAAGCRWHEPRRVVTKASLIGSGIGARIECQLADGERVPARWIGADLNEDLAVLELETDTLEGLDCTILTSGSPLPGSVIVTPRQKGEFGTGFVICEPRRFTLRQSSSASARAYLGVRTQLRREGLMVYRVAPRSAAERAGIKNGDKVLSVNEQPVMDPEALVAIIASHRIGDVLVLKMERGEEERTLEIALGSIDRDEDAPHDQWGGGPFSLRRFGMGTVLAHDTPLGPEECGGPLLDAEGRIIGVNISRALRIATYAIPSANVDRIINSLNP
jgi:serine protease Do